MGINRIDIKEDGGIRTLIDISDSTITEDSVVEGLVGYGGDGEKIVGKNPYKKTETDKEVQTQEELIEEILQELDSKASGGGGIDTSDATATPEDIANGVTAYVNGEKITGTVETHTGVVTDSMSSMSSNADNRLVVGYTFNIPKLFKQNARLNITAPLSLLGNAQATDVLKGKTFTGAGGYKVTGTYEPPTGGVDTSDATATASDMAEGTTAYVNGEKVTGTLLVCEDGNPNKPVFREVYNSSESGEAIQFMLPWTKPETVDGVILKDGGVIVARIPKTEFGDATASDVVEGKTFTSADGFKKTGTMKVSSGVTLPEGAVVIQKVIGAEASTQVSSGHSLSITYGSDVEINDSLALAFVGSTSTLSNISSNTDFSVLQGKYIRSGSSMGSTTSTYYYIPDDASFVVGGSSYSKTLTCDKAQKVTIQKVAL